MAIGMVIVAMLGLVFMAIFQNKNYNYDRIIIYGQDNDGQTFSLVLESSRSEVFAGLYEHFYTVDILYKDEVYRDYIQKSKIGASIQNIGFLNNFRYRSALDKTSESYDFKIDIKNINLQVAIPKLESDFLVKNSLTDFRYISSSVAAVQVGDQKFNAHVMTDRIISTDFLKMATLEQTKLVTSSLALWDESGNYYHIDITKVKSSNANYQSHTWILYKDARTNSTSKIFEGSINVIKVDQNTPKQVTITIPKLNNTKISLVSDWVLSHRNFDTVQTVLGQVIDIDGEREISGYYHFIDNTK